MKGKFALTLTSHRILGPVFNAVIINPSPNREYYTVADRLSVVNLAQYEGYLQPEEIELVKIIEEYSDTQLLKVFSKKKISAQDFLASVNEMLYESQIRPYIERRLLRCANLFTGTDIPVFLKKQHNNIYDTDRLILQDDNANAVFNFNRNKEGIQYHLTINYGEEDIGLCGRAGFVLTNDPCLLVLENRIFQFDDIDGKKLLPFFKKKSISIRPETEKKFLETFAIHVIQKYKVHATGFTITDVHVQPQPQLSIETGLSGMPVLMLRFRYGDKTEFYAGKKSELLVTLKKNDDEVEFSRLNRNLNYENQVVSSLLELGLTNIDSCSFIPMHGRRKENILQTYNLVNWLNFNKHALEQLGIEVWQTGHNTRYYLQQVELKLHVGSTQNDWFDILATVVFDGFEIPFYTFRPYILEGRREYELPDGRIVVLPEEWFSRFSDLLSFAKESGSQLILDKQHFTILQDSLSGLGSSGYAGKLKTWLNTQDFEDQDVPVQIHAELRDYQRKGYSWMWQLYLHDFGGCLADDMGLGKTLQTLTLLQQVVLYERQRHCGPQTSKFASQLTIFDVMPETDVRTKPSLIVVPSTLVHNWSNEAAKFAPQLKTGVYAGSGRREFSYYYHGLDVIITSYGLLRNDLEILKCYDFLYVVLDESQVIKNPRSKTYKAVVCLTAAHRLVLTGTPIENSLTDLWAQMNFLNPGLLGNFEFFKNQFVIPIEKNHEQKPSRVLQSLIQPFVMRRTKNEVARELPAIAQQVIYCNMSESQQAFMKLRNRRFGIIFWATSESRGLKSRHFSFCSRSPGSGRWPIIRSW